MRNTNLIFCLVLCILTFHFSSSSTACEMDEYTCGSGRCIPRSWVCDGTADCFTDNSDEQNCGHVTCDENRFRCVSTGECIAAAWRCDSDPTDCEDGSDEVGCDPFLKNEDSLLH